MTILKVPLPSPQIAECTYQAWSGIYWASTVLYLSSATPAPFYKDAKKDKDNTGIQP